eukprot:EG_transcript_16103
MKREAVERKKEESRQERALTNAEHKRRRAAEWEQLTEEEQAARRQRSAEARALRQQQREESLTKWLGAYKCAPRVVVDMDFDEKMFDHEIKSMCQQIMYCWSVIKRAEQPIQLSVCGLQPGTRLHKNLTSKPGISEWQMPISDVPFYELLEDRSNIVYFTADSDNVIRTLDPDKVYVIGGIVDHNRHKGLTLERAQAHRCSHGKLPLEEFLDLTENHGRFSKVLTVNHMVGVLTKFHETKDWPAAFVHAIPARKGIQAQDAASDGTGDGQDDAEDPAANPEEEGEEGGERAGEAAADPERDGCPDAKGETDGHTAAPPENLATASLATG